jgi:ABC-type glutathione transport system ATPase component
VPATIQLRSSDTLRQRLSLTSLLIAHDLAVVRAPGHQVACHFPLLPLTTAAG